MRTIQRSALVMYSARQMYDLVNEVEHYPAFLPWCSGAQVLKRDETMQEARVHVGRAGISESFVTSNTMVPGERIELTLKEGPFVSLSGVWSFETLAEDACKVSLELCFEMKSGLLQKAVGKVFEQAASTMVDAFCSRAKDIYG